MAALSILALNIAHPTPQRAPALLEYLWHREEDLLVLTEVGTGEGSRLVEQVCRAAGHALLGPGPLPAREHGVLLVARGGLGLQPDEEAPAVATLPHRRQAALAQGLRVWGVYGAASDPVRYSSAPQRARKRAWLSALAGSLDEAAGAGASPDVLVGDLNVVAPGHDPALRYVLEEERRWVEHALSPAGHGGLGLVDALALPASSAGRDEPSWVDHSGAAARYDHALLSPAAAAQVSSAGLDQTPREEGLSDHAALWLHLA